MIFCPKTALHRYFGLNQALDQAIAFVLNTDLNALPEGRTETGGPVYANRFSYDTQPEDELQYEAHLKNTDVHVLLSGRETIWTAALETQQETARDEEADFIGSQGAWQSQFCMTPDQVLIVFPGEAHKVKGLSGVPCWVEKLVVKVLEG